MAPQLGTLTTNIEIINRFRAGVVGPRSERRALQPVSRTIMFGERSSSSSSWSAGRRATTRRGSAGFFFGGRGQPSCRRRPTGRRLARKKRGIRRVASRRKTLRCCCCCCSGGGGVVRTTYSRLRTRMDAGRRRRPGSTVTDAAPYGRGPSSDTHARTRDSQPAGRTRQTRARNRPPPK